ncbi:MAG: aminotransferase class V-fold PLP-dependent enzyme [Bacteroidetes bacterium]|nr:aminotransferase class V-fold PLP-dependent enzyme [Bacteroidota bacterium]
MKATRRSFIKQLSGGVIGGLALISVPSASRARYIISENQNIGLRDEEFWKVVRQQFPLNDKRTYLNNGTMGPSPFVVLETVKNHMTDIDTTGHYGGWEVARGRLASFVGVEEKEISLTHNVTEGINIVTWGLPLKRGDEVIMTTHEHAGNALPWLNRARLDGIRIRTFEPAMTADENLNRINDLINKKTRVIAVPHVSCTIGLVLPVKEISKLGHDKGLFVFIDGAHGPGTMNLNMKEIGCDFYASCCHKWMVGPKGTGFLFVDQSMLDTLQTYWIGGHSDTGWDLTVDPPVFNGYVATAHRYDFATQNASIYIGVAASIDFLNSIGMKNIITRGRGLAKHLQDALLDMGDKIEMLTPTEDRSRGFVNGFRIKNMQHSDFGKLATKRKFRIRLVGEAKLNSIRISTHLYNNFDEVDRFIELVKEVA